MIDEDFFYFINHILMKGRFRIARAVVDYLYLECEKLDQ